MQVRPFLMFTGEAEAAMAFYRSIFPDAVPGEIQRHENGTGLLRASLSIAGQEIRFFDSPPVHDFGFTPAISLFVDCDDEAQLDAFWSALSEGGSPLMPVGDYGFSRKFGWLNDRFGVSWQLNLA